MPFTFTHTYSVFQKYPSAAACSVRLAYAFARATTAPAVAVPAAAVAAAAGATSQLSSLQAPGAVARTISVQNLLLCGDRRHMAPAQRLHVLEKQLRGESGRLCTSHAICVPCAPNAVHTERTNIACGTCWCQHATEVPANKLVPAMQMLVAMQHGSL
jgi:hypothetical protein